jgi:hypothetical protein
MYDLKEENSKEQEEEDDQEDSKHNFLCSLLIQSISNKYKLQI